MKETFEKFQEVEAVRSVLFKQISLAAKKIIQAYERIHKEADVKLPRTFWAGCDFECTEPHGITGEDMLYFTGEKWEDYYDWECPARWLWEDDWQEKLAEEIRRQQQAIAEAKAAADEHQAEKTKKARRELYEQLKKEYGD